jgi:hypothetical protein
METGMKRIIMRGIAIAVFGRLRQDWLLDERGDTLLYSQETSSELAK